MLFKETEFFCVFDTATEDGIRSFDVQRLKNTAEFYCCSYR